MMAMKMFSRPLLSESSPSIPIILRFDLFIVSQISWMFCVRNILDLILSLTNVLISTILSFMPEILFSISCIPWEVLASEVPDYISKPFLSSFLCGF